MSELMEFDGLPLPEFELSFERDGVYYVFNSNYQSSVEPYGSLTDEENTMRVRHNTNEKKLISEVILAKVAFVFEDKPAVDYVHNTLPDHYALFYVQGNLRALDLVRKLAETHRVLSRSTHPEAAKGLEPDGIPTDQDSFELSQSQAAEILISVAEELDYELPENYLRMNGCL